MANERLINSVSVGVIFVGDTGDYEISPEEQTHIMAEVQNGLELLAENESDSNASFVYGSLSVNINGYVPWQGANWPGLPETFYKGFDAALWSEPNQKIYFFKGPNYVRVDPDNGWQMDAGYPKPIAGNWPGFPANFANGIDAALWGDPNSKIYFFKGDEYIRVDPSNGWQVDSGYPKPISGNWPGLPADFAEGIDATLWSDPNGKIYFFKNYADQQPMYVRIDPSNGWNMDPGYPKTVAGNWPGLPESFTDSGKTLDAALWGQPNGKIYFFQKQRIVGKYVRVDPDNGWQMDDGYPKPIGLGWGATELLWRDPALDALGFGTGGDGLNAAVEFFQNAAGAQYGYVVFFTKLPTVWFAYAGGRRVVMRQSDTTAGSFLGWTSIDRVFAHETGHIFGAPDEYGSSGCACTTTHGRFISEVNGNCANCADDLVPCVMRSGAANIACDFTYKHLGWHAFLRRIDAAIYTFANNKIYMFSNDYYIRFTGFDMDPDYPKPIAGNWPGFPADFAEGVDAALWSDKNHRIYFFKGSQYIRVNPANGWAVDPGYPKPISGNWPGVTGGFAEGLDATLWSDPTEKLYFFKGSEYLRINPNNGWNVDPGYPKPIAGNWPGFPSDFASGVDAAVWSDSNSRIYFFRKNKYIRVNPANGWNVDPGYPRWINKNWMDFPEGFVPDITDITS